MTTLLALQVHHTGDKTHAEADQRKNRKGQQQGLLHDDTDKATNPANSGGDQAGNGTSDGANGGSSRRAACSSFILD